MWIYEKKLQYPVKIANPNPRLAGIIVDALGGVFIIGDDLHTEATADIYKGFADSSRADNTCSLALELDSYPVSTSEVAVVNAFISCAKVSMVPPQ